MSITKEAIVICCFLALNALSHQFQCASAKKNGKRNQDGWMEPDERIKRLMIINEREIKSYILYELGEKMGDNVNFQLLEPVTFRRTYEDRGYFHHIKLHIVYRHKEMFGLVVIFDNLSSETSLVDSFKMLKIDDDVKARKNPK